jgi:hypothetical protein
MRRRSQRLGRTAFNLPQLGAVIHGANRWPGHIQYVLLSDTRSLEFGISEANRSRQIHASSEGYLRRSIMPRRQRPFWRWPNTASGLRAQVCPVRFREFFRASMPIYQRTAASSLTEPRKGIATGAGASPMSSQNSALSLSAARPR